MERQVAEQGYQKKSSSQNKPQKQNLPVKEKIEDKNKNQEPVKQEPKKEEQKKEEIKKPTETKTETKPVEKPGIKKEYAVVYGKDLPLSYKMSGAICRFIKNKNPEKCIELLELVRMQRMSIPVRGESAHRKDQKNGYARGKYPEKSSRFFIKLLKSLIANAKVNNLDTEKIIITIAKADKASNPIRGTRLGLGRKKFKRAHIFIKVEEKKDKTAKNKIKDNKPKRN
jgi:ribosomal protein L22